MTDKEKTEKKLAVVNELPTTQLREVETSEGTFECLTVVEALTEILETVRELKKKL